MQSSEHDMSGVSGLSSLSFDDKDRCRADVTQTEETEPDENPFADVIADAVAGSPAQQEMWLFLNSVPSETGFRVYAPKYELLSVGLVIVLLLEDIVLSVKEVGDVVNSWRATKWFEYLAYVIFTSEYVLRVWACMASKALNNGSCRAATIGRAKFAVGGLLMVDFVVLGAFYLQLYVDLVYSAKTGSKLQGLQVLRMFRAFRAFRSAKMLKVDRKANALGVLIKVLEAEATPIMATLTIAFMLVIILATLMFYIENDAQPDQYSSIPAAMWWSVTALTSVGYGDVYPITVCGKILGCFACIVGAGIIALPTGILSNGFNEEICVGEDAMQAQVIEESILDTTQKLETLNQEIKGLYSGLDEVDVSQQHLIKAFRQLYPEKVMQILGPEVQENIQILEASHGAKAGLGWPPAAAALTENELGAVRDKVEAQVAALIKKRRRPGFFMKGMVLNVPSSS